MQGYGKDYQYAHDDPAGIADQQHFPDQLIGKRSGCLSMTFLLKRTQEGYSTNPRTADMKGRLKVEWLIGRKNFSERGRKLDLFQRENSEHFEKSEAKEWHSMLQLFGLLMILVLPSETGEFSGNAMVSDCRLA